MLDARFGGFALKKKKKHLTCAKGPSTFVAVFQLPSSDSVAEIYGNSHTGGEERNGAAHRARKGRRRNEKRSGSGAGTMHRFRLQLPRTAEPQQQRADGPLVLQHAAAAAYIHHTTASAAAERARQKKKKNSHRSSSSLVRGLRPRNAALAGRGNARRRRKLARDSVHEQRTRRGDPVTSTIPE